MNPRKVIRDQVAQLTDLPNVGKACVADLVLLGIHSPSDLIGKCPYAMYEQLCAITATRHDPCVMDVFISITRYMAGEEARAWWHYTAERKARFQ
jgi:Pathogenicity locus